MERTCTYVVFVISNIISLLFNLTGTMQKKKNGDKILCTPFFFINNQN